MHTNTDAHRFLRSRRSIRRFADTPFEPEKITRILETAVYAPSAHNSQPWRFAVLTSSNSKRELAEKMAEKFKFDLQKDQIPEEEIRSRLDRSKSRIINAPVIIILCLDGTALDQYKDKRRQNAEIIMGVQSVAMAGLQLLLAAHAEGLGGVWTCGPLFAPDVVQSTLSLSKSWKPQGMLLLGYPGEQPKVKELNKLEDTVAYID